jgi:hypothetical protein
MALQHEWERFAVDGVRGGTYSSILMDHADLGQIRASFAAVNWPSVSA